MSSSDVIPGPASTSPSSAQEADPKHSFLARLFFGELPLAVAASLRDEPERWRKGSWCWLVHDTDLHLWIGNNAYGMALHEGWMGTELWGGVSGWSTFGLSPGHWLLRRAADRWLSGDPLTGLRKLRPLTDGASTRQDGMADDGPGMNP